MAPLDGALLPPASLPAPVDVEVGPVKVGEGELTAAALLLAAALLMEAKCEDTSDEAAAPEDVVAELPVLVAAVDNVVAAALSLVAAADVSEAEAESAL